MGFFANFTGYTIQFVKNEEGYFWEKMEYGVIYQKYGVLLKKSEFSGKSKIGIDISRINIKTDSN